MYRLPEADPNDTGFMDAAQWHLAPDGYWLVRTQRTGSGTAEILLYHHDGKGNLVPISGFDNQVYEFYSRYSGLARDQLAIDHCWADFVQWSGPHRAILKISGESTMCKPMWVTEDWRMGYDFEEKAFFLTEDIINRNEHGLYPVVHPVERPSEMLHQ